MSELQDNPDAWHEQLAKQDALLEQQKREAKERKERPWGFNMGVLKQIYEDKKMHAEKRIGDLEKKKETYNKRWPLLLYSDAHFKSVNTEISYYRKYYEQEAALYHLFKHLGEELWEMECKIQQNFTNLDERLMHIEKFLTDDITKEEFLRKI